MYSYHESNWKMTLQHLKLMELHRSNGWRWKFRCRDRLDWNPKLNLRFQAQHEPEHEPSIVRPNFSTWNLSPGSGDDPLRRSAWTKTDQPEPIASLMWTLRSRMWKTISSMSIGNLDVEQCDWFIKLFASRLLSYWFIVCLLITSDTLISENT